MGVHILIVTASAITISWYLSKQSDRWIWLIGGYIFGILGGTIASFAVAFIVFPELGVTTWGQNDDNLYMLRHFIKGFVYSLPAAAVGIWLGRANQKKASKADMAFVDYGLVEQWLNERGIDAENANFSHYTVKGLARLSGANVIVGQGQRPGKMIGFLVEINAVNNRVEGYLIDSNRASWHRQAVAQAKFHKKPLIEFLDADAGRDTDKLVPDGELQNCIDEELQSLEDTRSLGDFPFLPTAPDVTHQTPIATFRAGDIVLLYLKDPPTIAETTNQEYSPIKYRYCLACISIAKRLPILFVGLEEGMFGTICVGVSEPGGGHSNAGSGDGYDEATFLHKAIEIFRDITGYTGEIMRV